MSGFSLPEEVTVWTPSGQTVDGGKTWNAPVLLDARVADHVEELIDVEGKRVMTKIAVYTRTNIAPGSYVSKGDETASATPEDVSGSERVLLSIAIATMSDMNKAVA